MSDPLRAASDNEMAIAADAITFIVRILHSSG
jgi:hypothetical protein